MTKRAGILRISVPLLEAVFGGKCKVEKVAITWEDLIQNTITVQVTDHETLPEQEPEGLVHPVVCNFSKSADGEIDIAFGASHPEVIESILKARERKSQSAEEPIATF
ncbi:hypothetical protein [Tautonia plasticadhaerens]|uniref:hypothetical protein n=1 Tax=Tautonia plasticadhaerens TaxID=2527974 RepID=UPI0011A50F6F|nr:hypothetical protein [Tautonia plasticadhaerens]